MDMIPNRARKGRGAIANPDSRFDRERRERVDDGWAVAGLEEELPRLETTVTPDASRTVIAWNESPDIGFDRSINPYRGCEHGCIYCFARPSHAFLGLSPGLDFETRLTAKYDAPEILDRELRAKSYRCAVMGLGTNTDPYQPVEREHRITRRVLEVLSAFEHPVSIVTKSALILRDLDILAPMAARRLVRVHVSVTTLDPGLARRMEPRASTPARRLAAIAGLAEAGVPVGVMAAPMIPALNDQEMEAILERSAAAGARTAGMTLLRLPHELKGLVTEWLEEHAPGRAGHVLSLVREMRGGKLNDSRFGERFRGQGPYAQMLHQRFKLACKRLGLNGTGAPALDTSRFRPPLATRDQPALF